MKTIELEEKSLDYNDILNYVDSRYAYLAMDKDGGIYAYAGKPSLDQRGWATDGSGCIPINLSVHNKPDWKESLIARKTDVSPDENTPWGTPIEVRDDVKESWREAVFIRLEDDPRHNRYDCLVKGEFEYDSYRYCRIKEER